MDPDSKRRKLNPPPRRVRNAVVPATENNPKVSNSLQVAGSHLKVQQARSFAVSQAQQEGSTTNFRIFDSPFGNFLIPAVPTRSELSSGRSFPDDAHLQTNPNALLGSSMQNLLL